jgi:hypothetical protein
MVTDTQESTERLPWDSFLEREVTQKFRITPSALGQVRRMIDRFREVEWPNIRRDLGQPPYNWDVPDSLEPHWVAPGYAIYWQELIIREPIEHYDGDTVRRVLEDVSKGWHPTDSGLPANNPSVIAHYLNKGFRLRPPTAGVSVETLEATVPSEALVRMSEEAIEDDKPEYLCSRHGYRRKSFITWKGYVRHCVESNELLEYDPPQFMMDLLKDYPYVCMVHGKGFRNARHAGRHYRSEMRKPGRSIHPNLEQMKIGVQNG